MKTWLQHFLKLGVLMTPPALILGILDYRFRNYFWSSLDRFRLFQGEAMFDFFSLFSGFVVLLFILWMASSGWKKLRQMPVYFAIVVASLALGAEFSLELNQAVEPVIRSAGHQFVLLYMLPVMLCLVLFTELQSAELRRRFLWSFLISTSVLGLLSLSQFVWEWLPGAGRDFLGRGVWPYIDPFVEMKPESANWLAYLFGPALVLSLIEGWRERSWLYAAPALVSLAVLLMTQSYTSLGIVAALVAWFVLWVAPRKWRMGLVGLGLILAVAFVGSQWNSPKFQALLGNYHLPNSIERRAQIYGFTWEQFKADPVAGIGLGNYQSVFREEQADVLTEVIPEKELPPHPHNLLANAWSDLGLLGLMAFGLIYAVTAWRVLLQPLARPYYLALAYPLGHGLADTPYGLEEAAMLFWILVSLALISEIAPKVSKSVIFRSK